MLFGQRAYDQISHDVARMDLPVVFGIDRCGLVGEDGETHHGVFDIAMLRPLPNMILSQDHYRIPILRKINHRKAYRFHILRLTE